MQIRNFIENQDILQKIVLVLTPELFKNSL